MKKIFSAFLSAVLLFCLGLPVYGTDGSVTVSDADAFMRALEQPGVEEVMLRGGVYRLKDGLTMDNRQNLTIASYPGEVATLTNAMPLENWQTCTVNGVQVFVTDAKGMQRPTLFSDTKDVHVTRLPETGFYYVESPDLTDAKDDQYDVRSNAFFASDLKAEPANVQDVSVGVLHSWVNDLMGMVSYDATTGRILLNKYAGRPIESEDRYYLENVQESLDKPGEFCFDTKTDKIYYVPYAGETVDNVQLFASDEPEFISITNSDNITFENIRIADTGWTYSDEAFLNTNIHRVHRDYPCASYQGGNDVCGAVTVSYSENIQFSHCDFVNIGCTAIRFFDGARHCLANSCYFRNIGSSAVFIGGRFDFGDNAVNDPKNYAEDVNVTNCEVDGFSQRFSGSCGIIVTYCDGATLQHNEIHDGCYSGISVGFTWLFLDNPTAHISVLDNLIYNIGLHTLSDLGGIYLLGVQEGTIVTGNVIHDVTMYDGFSGYAGCGIYLDSGCQYMTVEKNLVFNCDTSGFNTTISKGNTIRNNIFALCGESTANIGAPDFGDTLPDLNSEYSHNIFLTDGQVLSVEYMGNPRHFSGTGNIIWDLSQGKDTYFAQGTRTGKTLPRIFAKWKGLLQSAVFMNPGFTDARHFDFTFSEGAGIEETGFRIFDYEGAGTLKNTTIGTAKAGGLTGYNDGCQPVQQRPVKLNFFQRLLQWIVKMISNIKNIF